MEEIILEGAAVEVGGTELTVVLRRRAREVSSARRFCWARSWL
jgi:hypothetical protein